MPPVKTEMPEVRVTLTRKQTELMQTLRQRDGIAIEKSADQMDEIQYASERDLAIQNVDRDSHLLREVKSALLRLEKGLFGTCKDCEEVISPKRMAAVPWALRCIRCQEVEDNLQKGGAEIEDEDMAHAA